MSERMGFTSNYIYDIEDYKKLRKKIEEYGNSKWMCLAPEEEFHTENWIISTKDKEDR